MSKSKVFPQRRSKRELKMTSYTFKVVLEKDKWPDEPESQAVWRAYIPELPSAHAWGDTPKEAMERLKDAVELLIEYMLEHGESIPQELQAYVTVSHEPLITVTV